MVPWRLYFTYRADLLHRQAGVGAVERLDLIDRQHGGLGRRIEIKADQVARLVD